MPRHADRAADALRPLDFDLSPPSLAHGAVLVSMGQTTVLCTCSVEPAVPEFRVGSGKGWLTAEYNMLPGSTLPRKARDRGGKVDGRSVEIQRLIGRALRTIVDFEKLGERTLWVDCDVLRADGGTRTACINGAMLALVAALAAQRSTLPHPPRELIKGLVAAVSVGLVNEEILLDLDYREDRVAAVDLNVVMTDRGQFIEVQAGGEEATFTPSQLGQMLSLGEQGIARIIAAQQAVLAAHESLD
ncbi:MAG TPA: ribonuclease PH [Gemmatales bacterium]|nr:ribonuclease PH [Gemmatales bacterium]